MDLLQIDDDEKGSENDSCGVGLWFDAYRLSFGSSIKRLWRCMPSELTSLLSGLFYYCFRIFKNLAFKKFLDPKFHRGLKLLLVPWGLIQLHSSTRGQTDTTGVSFTLSP